MPHNLLIGNYSVGHVGSTHDAYTFQSTWLYREHADLLDDDNWVWADSAYPVEMWCIPPFKKPRNGVLTCNQRTFNYHLSHVHSLNVLKILLTRWFRFGFGLNMPLQRLKDIFNRFGSFATPSPQKRTFTIQVIGSYAVSFSTI